MEPQQHEVGASTTPTTYDSNPFTAAWTGIQKLIKTNSQTVIGVAFFNILLTAILVLSVVAMVLALITFALHHDTALTATYSLPSNTALGFLTSMNDGSIYLTWLIGLAVCVFAVSLMQSLQLNVALAAARGVTLKFGALLKSSVKTALPILGYVALVILTLIVAVILIALLASILGYTTILVVFLAVVAAVYVGLRLSFTVYAIVDQRVGPIVAVKQSWKTTQGHLIETVGSSFVGLSIVAIPGVVITALSRATEGMSTLSSLFGLLGAIVSTVLVIAATMALAERYVQIRAVKDNGLTAAPLSSFNYLAIGLGILSLFVLNALSPKVNNQNPADPFNGVYGAPTQDSNTDTSYPTTLN